jgi:hypothetical protein
LPVPNRKGTPLREFIVAAEELEKELDGTPKEEQYVEIPLVDQDKDGKETGRRVLRAYPPTDGQLTFMLAALGRGQTSDQRFAAIINIMLSSMREEDQDYLETRLLSRDPKVRLPVQVVEQIFEELIAEWFGRPTPPQSDSAPSPQSDSQN